MNQAPPSPHLHMVDLPLPLTGFRHFVASWLYTGSDATVLVDPGPASAIPALLAALERRGVKAVDFILLTHVHIDHSGGVGHLLLSYPEARVICHPRGSRHLIEPEKVWNVSLRNLGEIAQMYGKPEPVPADRIGFEESVRIGRLSIESIETPGHAPHHLAFLLDGALFTGEAAGIFFPLADAFYLRVGCPPGGFDYPAYRRSLERMRSVEASLLCFGHYGYARDVRGILDLARDQLDLWMSVAQKHAGEPEGIFEEKTRAELLATDPGIARFPDLPDDVRTREHWHLLHSIAGFRPYLATD
ncbi:MAG TPA: MBL fold metallo-hydrolase [Syntrophales bacterium]|nr:MBL fold metallo-hydrolase [Syntrophales bacterium]